jgi:hypothetical protein
MFESKKEKELKRLHDIQLQNISDQSDDYMIGLYNGLELVLSIFEDRDPEFKTSSKTPEIIYNEEPSGRTMASGKRKR